jgi:hypothetical protein
MVFTISPTEAQSMVEDEAQLLGAIAQASKAAIALALLRQSQPITHTPSDTLRIQMGRRLVYGRLNDGQFRNDLAPETLKAIFDAVQRPVSENVDPSKYKGKIPAIEIRDGDTILFREERDGTVTANAIQFQLEQNTAQQKNTVAPTSQAIDSATPAENKADQLAHVAHYLLNPLSEDRPIYDSVVIGDYKIKRGENNIVTVSRGDSLILVTREGEVVSDRITEADWLAFQSIYEQIQPQLMQPYEQGNEELLDRQYKDVYELWEDLDHMTPDELLFMATQRFNLYPEGKSATELENGLLEQYEMMQDILQAYKQEQEGGAFLNNEDRVTLTADTADATAPQDTLPAIAIAERETAKLPHGATKQLLQSTYQDWKQHIHQEFKQGHTWLKSRPENWRNQKTARAALDLFKRGYERTGERSYQVGEYIISSKGRNLYTLKDAKGELMRFSATQNPVMSLRRIQILGVSDRFNDFHHKTVQTLQRNRTITPQGSLDVEATYTAKTNRVESTVLQFLQTKARANVWDKEGGQFRMEIGAGGLLRITDKQNDRGVVFQRQNGAVFSKLNAQDFAHFERLADRMQRGRNTTRSPSETRAHTARRSSGLELA